MTAVAAAPASVTSPVAERVLPPAPSRHRIDATLRLLSGLGLWASLLLVTYWWDAGGGITDLAGWETGLTSVGRLSGLLSADLLLIQVLMMARLPFLENAFGRDRLARLHRVVGFVSFDLMVLHVLTITYGYAAGRLGAVPGTFWELLTSAAGVLLSLGGTVALVMVVLTSIRAARRKLRYESWHLLHLYAYLGVGLALPHQLWTGREFLASTGRTVFWWGLWSAASAAILVWRVGLPLWRTLRYRLTVTSVVDEGHGVVSVYLTGRHLDRLPVEAGQFLTVRFLAGPGWTRANPYSLSAAPDGRSLRLTAKALGDGSARMARLQPGTRVVFEGPYGRLADRARAHHRVALIGAGVGITPLRALAEGLDYAPGGATLLHRYATDPLFAWEFGVLAAERGLQIVNLPGRRRGPDSWLGEGMGMVDDLTALRYWIPDVAERDVYVCGPAVWAAAVQRTVEDAGTPRDRIHVESFGW